MTEVTAKAAGTLEIGGDLEVARLAYGAMRLTGQPGNWGPYPDPAGGILGNISSGFVGNNQITNRSLCQWFRKSSRWPVGSVCAYALIVGPLPVHFFSRFRIPKTVCLSATNSFGRSLLAIPPR